MKTITIAAIVTLDETHPNCPTTEELLLAVENALLTPDNEVFGIQDIRVSLAEKQCVAS